MYARLSLLSALLLVPMALRAETYTYTGNDFTGFTQSPSPYSASDSIDGFFTVATALGDNLTNDNITSLVTNFSFTDGGVDPAITPSNKGGELFMVSTNSLGQIIAWDVNLGDNVATPNNDLMFTCDGFSGVNQCAISPIDEAYENNGGTTAYVQSDPGTWAETTTSVAATPEPSSLALMSTGLLAFAFMARKRLVASVL